MTIFIYTLTVDAKTSTITKGDVLANLEFTSSKEKAKLFLYTSSSTREPVYTYDAKTTIAGELGNTYYNSEINTELWQKIQFIAYFGYGYKDRSDISWYLVTQNLIWNTYLDGKDKIIFSDTLTEEQYNEKAREILKDVEVITTFPSFTSNNSNDIALTTRPQEELTFIDTNNVLDTFEIQREEDFDYRVEGNKLYLTLFTPNPKKTITLKRSITDKMPYIEVYLTGDMPVAFSRGHQEFLNSYINITSLFSKVLLNFPRQGYYPELTNLKYGLYYQSSDRLYKEFLVDDNNNLYIEEAYPDVYYIKEINNSYGYTANRDKIPLSIDSYDYELKTIDIVKEPLIKNIIFKKNLKNNDGSIISLIDTEFRVLDKDLKELFTFRTNNIGEAFLNLPYGNFYIEQVDANLGYENELIKLKVNESTKEDLTIESKEIIGIVNLSFKDYTSKNLIKGISSFKIKRINTRMTEELLTYETESGELKLEDLPLGNYQITDISIPDNYSLNTKEVNFAITEEENNVDVTIYSELKTGSIKITYLDKFTNKPIKDGLFKIFNTLNECLYEVKTDELGVIKLQNVPLGNYYLKQVLSESRDILDEEKIDISVKENVETNITIQDRSEVEVPITGKKTVKWYGIFFIGLLSSVIFYEKKKA